MRISFKSLLFVLPFVLGAAGCGGWMSGGGKRAPKYVPVLLAQLPGADTHQLERGGGGAVVGKSTFGFSDHATVWTGSPLVPADLHPAGALGSSALATNGTATVGSFFNNGDRAARWTGTSNAPQDLHPAGYTASVATALDGTVTYGYADLSGTRRPMAWTSGAGSAIELEFVGYDGAQVRAAQDGLVVGYGFQGQNDSALAWPTMNGPAVKLSVLGGYQTTAAYGTDGVRIFGTGFNGTTSSPLVWPNLNSAPIALPTPGFNSGRAIASNGALIVGEVRSQIIPSAALWEGPSFLFTNLHALLSGIKKGNTTLSPEYSFAVAVDSAGNVYGYLHDANLGDLAVVWKRE